jgi:hypothetical protein
MKWMGGRMSKQLRMLAMNSECEIEDKNYEDTEAQTI